MVLMDALSYSFESFSVSSSTNKLGPLDETLLLGQEVVIQQSNWPAKCGDDEVTVVSESWKTARLLL